MGNYKKESMDILNDNLVTIIIAVVGWVIAIAQSVRNRKLQNANMLAERRAKVYSAFMCKIDDISAKMNTIPKRMMNDMVELLIKDFSDENKIDESKVLNFNSKLADIMSECIQPILILKQELNALRLVSSEELLVKIQELQDLTEALYDDFQSCYNKINFRDISTFKKFEMVDNESRNKRFKELYDEIIILMRKEIQLS